MEKINDGGSAFPVHAVYQDCGIDGNSGPVLTETINSGMTLRDYFAAKAMAALITTAGAPCLNGLDGYEQHTASASYKMADAMLKAREVKS